MLTDVMLTEFLKELAQLMSKKGWRDQEARNLLYYFILYTFDHELEPYLPYQMKKLNIGEPWLKDLFRLFEMVEGEEFREHCYFMLIYVLSDRDIEEIAVYLLTEFPLEQSTKNFLLAMVKYPGGNDNPENNNVKNDNAKSNEGRIRTVRKIFTSIFSRLLSLFQKNPKNDYQIVFLIEYLEPYILDDVLHENRLLKNKRYPWLPLSYLLFKSLSETNLDMFVAFLLEHGDKIKKFSMIAGFLCEPTHKDYFLKKWRMMLLEGNLNPLKLNQLLEIMESYFTSKIPSAKIDVLEKLYPEQIKRTLQLLLQLESLSTFLRGNNVLSRLITMISLKIQEQFLSQAAPLLNQIISLALEQPSLNPEDFDYNKVLSSIENFITQITTFHYPKEFEMVCSAFNQRLEDESLVSDAEISEQHRLDFIMKSFFIRIFSPAISTFLDNSHCTWEGKKDTTSDSREFIRKLLINIANIIQGKKSDNASLQELTNDTTRLSILNFIGEMAGVAPLPTLNSTTFASATYTTPFISKTKFVMSEYQTNLPPRIQFDNSFLEAVVGGHELRKPKLIMDKQDAGCIFWKFLINFRLKMFKQEYQEFVSNPHLKFIFQLTEVNKSLKPFKEIKGKIKERKITLVKEKLLELMAILSSFNPDLTLEHYCTAKISETKKQLDENLLMQGPLKQALESAIDIALDSSVKGKITLEFGKPLTVDTKSKLELQLKNLENAYQELMRQYCVHTWSKVYYDTRHLLEVLRVLESIQHGLKNFESDRKLSTPSELTPTVSSIGRLLPLPEIPSSASSLKM